VNNEMELRMKSFGMKRQLVIELSYTPPMFMSNVR